MRAKDEIERLRDEVRRLRGFCFGLGVLLACGLAAGFARTQDDVLRVRGIVVEDAEGRERILIGAPFPHAANRIRTDIERAKATWGAGYPNMDWYERLEHGGNGILILDEAGHDRLVLGDPCPDPSTGQRIDQGSGIQINDADGYERSGWGYFSNLDRVSFGLDHRHGEGLNLFLLEDGTAGMFVRDEAGGAFVGIANPDSILPGLDARLTGMAVVDSSGPRVLVDAAREPSVELRGEDGAVTARLPAE